MIYMANINDGWLRSETAVALLNSSGISHDGAQLVTRMQIIPFPPYLHCGRNALVEKYMKSGEEWCLFFDNDVEWKPNDISTIYLSADPLSRPIVSGCYANYDASGPFVVAYKEQTKENGDPDFIPLRPSDIANKTELIPIDSAGCGFLLVHRSVFEALEKEYDFPMQYFGEEIDGETWMGEDHTLCRRARRLGFPIYLNPNVQLDHYKTAKFSLEV